MIYANGVDLVARYDVDLIRDLITDREEVTRDQVSSHINVVTALEDASGEVEVALLSGGSYTVEQLEALDGNSQAHLKKIVCALAMAALHERRPEAAEREYIEALTKSGRDAIRALRNGENVFGIAENIDAGIIEVTSPTVSDVRRRNDLAFRMQRYFPDAEQRLPRRG